MAMKQVQSTIKVTAENLKEMIRLASDPEKELPALKLYNRLRFVEKDVLEAARDDFEEMVGKWAGKIDEHQSNKAGVCIWLAEHSVLSSADFREVLESAFRLAMPKYLAGNMIFNALETDNIQVPISEVAQRFRKCQKFSTNAYVFLDKGKDGCGWYKIVNLEKAKNAGENAGPMQITIQSPGSKVTNAEPLANFVKHMTLFQFKVEINVFATSNPGTKKGKDFYLSTLKQNAILPLSDEAAKHIIRLTAPWNAMSDADFEAWWNRESERTAAPRTFDEARSLSELHSMLTAGSGKNSAKTEKSAEKPVEIALTPEVSQKMTALFKKLSSMCLPSFDKSDRDNAAVRADVKKFLAGQKTVAECVAFFGAAQGTEEDKFAIFKELKGKVDFWPEPEVIKDGFDYDELSRLVIWTEIPAKLLPGFVEASRIYYRDTIGKLLTLAFQLPGKCLSAFFAKGIITPQNVDDYVVGKEDSALSSDFVLWAFKNRSHLLKGTVKSIDMDCCISAVSQERVPLQWLAAQRELRVALFGEPKDLKLLLLDNAGDDMASIPTAFRRYTGFQPKELQSVLVRYERWSEKFRQYLENNAEVTAAVMAEGEEEVTTTDLTSVLSLNKLKDELEHLVNVLIPENNKAYAVAKSYGDLRENAEFDIAKQRKKDLGRKRNDLEQELSRLSSTNFRDVVVDGTVVVGCMVTLALPGEPDVTYAILGARDGVPERNFISYNAPLGQVLRNKSVGNTVNLPNGKTATIKSVVALPEELRKELACEK